MEVALAHAQEVSSICTAFLLAHKSPSVLKSLVRQISPSGGKAAAATEEPILIPASRHWGAESISTLYHISFEQMSDQRYVLLESTLVVCIFVKKIRAAFN